MNLTKAEIHKRMTDWLLAWNSYDLEGVFLLFDNDIVFENWNGNTITGKNNLKREWYRWFAFHGNFRFTKEDIFVDEQEQKVLFSWTLKWPSIEKKLKGKPEVRRGVDVLHFKEGKIYKKYSYSKTTIEIDSEQVTLEVPHTIK
jgi:ketosteroid isomerase-like protein